MNPQQARAHAASNIDLATCHAVWVAPQILDAHGGGEVRLEEHFVGRCWFLCDPRDRVWVAERDLRPMHPEVPGPVWEQLLDEAAKRHDAAGNDLESARRGTEEEPDPPKTSDDSNPTADDTGPKVWLRVDLNEAYGRCGVCGEPVALHDRGQFAVFLRDTDEPVCERCAEHHAPGILAACERAKEKDERRFDYLWSMRHGWWEPTF